MSSFRRIFGFLLVGLAAFSPMSGQSSAARSARDRQEEPEVRFVSFVLDDVQKNWDKMLPAQAGIPYRHAKLVLYRGSFPSACGKARAATGPFYCPGDEKVYLDLEFFDELKRRFGAPGEFARAYVIAHEIGHHVQKLLGIEPRIRRLAEQNPGEANELSVRLELQADCFAGIWANSTEQRNLLNGNDIAAALRAAAAVGDDRLQKAAGRYVNPETFTHGSSEQRIQWFRRGLSMGRIGACDTMPKN
ncbi:MAG TPA: neutral zinc metallopeptidase [Bryobacteraceae bacterium]|nr:neutral zinc metallopeptidase [Bryobacteraceae bacterium]